MSVLSTLISILPGQLPDPSPDWDFIGTDVGIDIYNGLYAIVLILCGIALLVGGILIAFGKFGQHQGSFTAGLWTVGSAIGVAALSSGAAVLINWGTGLNVGS